MKKSHVKFTYFTQIPWAGVTSQCERSADKSKESAMALDT